jgi:hypothetical protein
MSRTKDFAHSIAEQRALDDMVVIDHGTESDNVEAEALRIVLQRIRQDNLALHQTLSRTTEERDQWRAAYYRALREKAECTTTTPPRPNGPLTN